MPLGQTAMTLMFAGNFAPTFFMCPSRKPWDSPSVAPGRMASSTLPNSSAWAASEMRSNTRSDSRTTASISPRVPFCSVNPALRRLGRRLGAGAQAHLHRDAGALQRLAQVLRLGGALRAPADHPDLLDAGEGLGQEGKQVAAALDDLLLVSLELDCLDVEHLGGKTQCAAAWGGSMAQPSGVARNAFWHNVAYVCKKLQRGGRAMMAASGALDYDTFRLFLHLSRTLRFARTSRECHISPSALSRAVQRLEREVGWPLFERDQRRVTLTPEGVRFAAHAREALEGWEELRRRLRGRSETLTGHHLAVRLGHRLPELLAPRAGRVPAAAPRGRTSPSRPATPPTPWRWPPRGGSTWRWPPSPTGCPRRC